MNIVKLFGYEINIFDFDEALSYAFELEKQDKVSQIVTINPEMFDCAKKDDKFSQILKNAEMVLPDGIGVKIALKLTGQKSNRIAGIDFAYKMLKLSAQNGFPIALIGAKQEVLLRAKENLENQISNLNIVYIHDGYFQDDKEIINDLKRTAPKLILAALGSPKQEKFIYNLKSSLNFGLAIGVGGSFDVWAGKVKRAPVIFQKFGLEWLYRTITQPERFKRIFPALPLFIFRALFAKIFNKY